MQLTQKLLSRMEELAGVFLKVGTLFLGGKKKENMLTIHSLLYVLKFWFP